MWSKWTRLGGFALSALLVVSSAGSSADAPAKDAKTNPFQALKDAFAKGVKTTDIEPKDLPREIRDGVARQAPEATIKKAQKSEIQHTLKYVAFDKPRVQSYQAVVVKDDKRVRVRVGPDGKKLDARPVADKGAARKAAASDDKKSIEIPEKAAKAVKAIKDLYPDAIVKAITTEVYQDPSGVVDVLTYEIEFFTKGVEREMVASPDGVIPHLWAVIAEKDLPKAVAETLAKEGEKIESVSQFELRAGLQFAPLEKARVVYRVEVEKEGKASTVNLRADGSAVPAPVRPGKPRAYLGVALEKNATTISEVTKDSPAAQAGLKVGDKIVALGDAKIGSVADLLKALQAHKPGTEVKLQVQRGDEVRSVALKLGSPPGQ